MNIDIDISTLQQRLLSAGFSPGGVDGILGPRTAGAIIALKKYCGLPADSEVDKATSIAIDMLIPHKAAGQKLSAHFNEDEFACKHCGTVRVNMKLVNKLEVLRSMCGGNPITVTSGYRCMDHNKAVGGAPLSQHVPGSAADIIISNTPVNVVPAKAIEAKFTGVGQYATFTHVDVRPGSAVQWKG